MLQKCNHSLYIYKLFRNTEHVLFLRSVLHEMSQSSQLGNLLVMYLIAGVAKDARKGHCVHIVSQNHLEGKFIAYKDSLSHCNIGSHSPIF